MNQTIKLTEFSHGGGCGCKIAPIVLEQILQSNLSTPDNQKLLVGNHTKDDAAVYDLGNGKALISTTDFFMPIVDDPFDFGRIASANAISDVYAMGGTPVLAIAILGWPVGKIPSEIAQKVIEGSRQICLQAGIPLAGGHSIDNPEPVFGLAVNGLVDIACLKRNDTAKEGDLLFLTKPVGVGILATAQKRKVLKSDHERLLLQQLTGLNNIGEELGKIKGVSAMTDVTGFGVLGHLIEMTEGSGLSSDLHFKNLVIAPGTLEYLSQGIRPGAAKRNRESYGDKVLFEDPSLQEASDILFDPQTNGGLLVAVDPSGLKEVEEVFKKFELHRFLKPIGRMKKHTAKVVSVINKD
jgi:selenide,water dikinase